MPSVHITQAKTTLSRLVEAIERGQEREFVITRRGRPAAKLVPLEALAVGTRLGVAKGLFKVPDDIDAHNDEVANLCMLTR
ncbi:type II toxin-antitoxin system Phd/YefM family antitoxin [Ideonella sp.]|jgi:prevent-host-death family protein|uniref:type II toxin-antitoxin system Phd/YefM family antitoxin n=1 Tax=Ideonella sp. TaxID=1929293 RepID=UPI0037BF8171